MSALFRRTRTLPPPCPPPELPYRPAVIRWRDAHEDEAGGWVAPESIDPEPCTITTVAFVVGVHLKPDHLTICQDVAPNGQLNGVTHLPLGMAPTIHYLG